MFAKAEYSSGYLLFVREATLFAQPFDVSRMELSGTPRPLATGIETNSGMAGFGASNSGTLAYRDAAANAFHFEWFDRTGRSAGRIGDDGVWGQFVLSPDARFVAAEQSERVGARADIWLFDPVRGVSNRLTNTADDELDVIWSPDSKSVAYSRGPDIFARDIDGGEEYRLVPESSDRKWPEDWSREQGLLFMSSAGLGRPIGSQINRQATGNGGPQSVWLQERFGVDEPHISPDGHWVAVHSNETGQYEVYVQPFPGPGRRVRVSTAGGGSPRWRGDGKELFYLTPDGSLMAAPIAIAGNTVEPGMPKRLLDTPIRLVRLNVDQYAVAPDGQRFLFLVPTDDTYQASITVITNWASGLGAHDRR